MRTFTCDNCHQTFPLDESGDVLAEAEWASVPEWQGRPRATVCDDCWKQIVLWWAKRQGLPVPE